MAMQNVEIQFITGLKRAIFRNPRVRGSWDSNGGYSDDWTEFQMQEEVGQDGCPILKASIALDSADQDKTFKWGVVPDGPQGSNFGGIPTEVPDVNSVERYRQFRLNSGGTTPQIERYYFTWGGRLGANKRLPGSTAPRLRFAVWAPNAQDVQAVFGKSDNGYITNEGVGIDPARPVVPISRSTDGIWEGAAPGDFENFKSLPYMYRIVNTQGQTLYRTDIFSRSQIGKGAINPIKGAWPGTVDSLDGTVSCSMVIDPDVVRRSFESTPAGAEPDLIPAASRTTAA